MAGLNTDGWYVRDLIDIGLKRWLDIGPYMNDRRQQMTMLRRNLVFDGLKKPFRLVLVDKQDRVLAKLGGYTTLTGRMTFWPVVFCRDGLTPQYRRQAIRALIEASIARAQASKNIRYIETMPAFDTPNRIVFQKILAELDFKFVSCAHAFTKKLSSKIIVPPDSPRPDLHLGPAREFPDQQLERLLRACQKQTFDHAQRDANLTGRAALQELRHYAGETAKSDLWLIACLGHRPVGFAFSGPVPDLNDKPGYAYLVELGVLPTCRGGGIGLFLVQSMMARLSQHRIKIVQSFLDDDNKPSLVLHKQLGFIRKPGSHWTWRRHFS